MESKKVEGLNLINPLLNYFVYNLVYLRTPIIILAHTKPEPIAKGNGIRHYWKMKCNKIVIYKPALRSCDLKDTQ